MLIIVNADDLGASESINNKIFELMEKGLVTSSTIIANAPAFEHVVENLHRFPECTFGIHLNLTTYRPLSKLRIIDELLCEDGNFTNKIFKTSFPVELLNAIFIELDSQISFAIDAGIPISHIDSHQHIHTLPQLILVLRKLIIKHGIYKVRATINMLPYNNVLGLVRSFKKKLYVNILRRMLSCRTTDCLCNLSVFYDNVINGNILKYNSYELMVHPGTTDAKYNKEVKLLESDDWARILPEQAIIGNYNSL